MKKRKKTKKNSSETNIDRVRRESPLFLFVYNLSVFTVYAGTMLFAWYFINLAYSIDQTSYDIMCSECEHSKHLIRIVLMTFWLLFFYFYLLNEIRFRIWDYCKKKSDIDVIKGNYYIVTIAVVIAVTTFLKVLI